MKWITLLLVIILLPALVWAQTTQAQLPKFTSVPPIENHELYYSFFNYHQTLLNVQSAAKAANPQNSAQLDQQMAALLQVNLQELPAVVANTQQVIKSYTDMTAEKTQALNALASASTKSVKPTARQLNAEYELKRARITAGAVMNLFQKLSPAAWDGVHAYITGPYKTTVYKH